ncbi:MAG: proprotein convertase P-domain-containing protein [Myxococcales bacterium]|nr:proprotein convertase P-domain-containing protein [Myxococcales bacterium]
MQRTLLAGVVAVLWAAPARADTLTTSLEQPIYEVSHTVDVRVAEGVATYRVRRTFMNPGTRADQAVLELDLPYGAAATGLRIRARNTWYQGELMERDKAAALYQEMTKFGPYKAKDPALLSWAWADKLYLQVFPVMPGQVAMVEYTLTAPTRYASGRYWLSYPRVDASAQVQHALASPLLTVHPSWGSAQTPIELDGHRIAIDTPTLLLAPAHPPWMELVAEDTQPASYVASTLVVPSSSHTTKPITTASLTLDIAHTYQSDLRVELITPQGKAVVVSDQAGDGTNDLKGTRTVALPPGTTGAGTWRLVVSDHAALDAGSLDGWQLAFGTGADATTATPTDVPMFIPDAPESASDAGVASICVGAPPITTWTARLGRVFASSEHAYARLELDVAPHVSELPKRAQVVFLVDRSRSVGDDGLTAQLAVIRAYLGHVPDAEVEIIAYHRLATRVFGRFVPAATALDQLGDLARGPTFQLGNGSAVDAAGKLAASALADRKGPRRVVVLSDELTRSALTPDAAVGSLAGLARETVVHVVVPVIDHDDRPHLERDDQGVLAQLATRHHGIEAKLGGFPAHTEKALAPLALELVRPTRIEQLAAKGFELESTTLAEGEGLRLFRLAATAPTRVVVTGKLWSDPVRREVLATEPFSRASAAFVFGEDKHQELSPIEQMRIALFARAVSPVTSYVAAEPGVRPSTDGLTDANLYGGLLGNEAGEMNGGFGFGANRPKPNLATLIDTRPCLRAHPQAGPWRVTLGVETTHEEVVDVTTKDGSPLAACLVEAAWSLRLEASAFTLPREQFVVELR